MSSTTTRIRHEPQPDAAILDRIEAVEDHGVRWVEESAESFAARLQAWREATGTLPEPSEDDLVEDRSACDLEGMDLSTYAEFLRMLMPGFVHGYGVGSLPGKPTQTRPNSEARIKVFQERIERKQTLFHPLDRQHVPSPEDAT